MNRTSLRSAFTLVEMLTVMTVIAILASLILAVNGYVQRKAGTSRAEGEIQALTLGCENYKVDNGIYPRSTDTDTLDPRTDANPATGVSSERYQKASLYLYKALSGDTQPSSGPDFKPEEKAYLTDFFRPQVLGASKNSNDQITKVHYIQDPFGNSYGYSTAGAKAEEEFQEDLRKDPSATRGPKYEKGFNPTFDLWSTAGAVKTGTAEQAKWVKNW